jgi:hypothetical protein
MIESNVTPREEVIFNVQTASVGCNNEKLIVRSSLKGKALRN